MEGTVVVNINSSNFLKWHVVVHLPIKFSISSSVPHDLLVESLNSLFTSLVILDGLVNVIDEDIEVFLIFGGDLIVGFLVLLEPSNYFFFVEVKGEWVLGKNVPFLCSSYLIGFGDIFEFLQSKSIKTEH